MIDAATKNAWDDIQYNMECCGVIDGTEDWQQVIGKGWLPASCCSLSAPLCEAAQLECPGSETPEPAICVPSPTQSYNKGCAKTFEDILSDNYVMIASIGFVLAFLQVAGIFSSVLIGADAADDEDDEKYEMGRKGKSTA